MIFTRSDIIQTYRDRIQSGDRLRLSKADLEILMEGFVESLSTAKTRDEIQKLCEAEIELLEEGYPQASVAKYLTRYRKTIMASIDHSILVLTEANSHRFIHQQRFTGLKEERLEHWALTYLKYTSEIYESIDKRSQLTNRGKQLNLRLVPVERYLILLRVFLSKKGQFEARWLAIAVAGLTGRRFAEVMAKGTFSLTKHPYLLRFEGQLKSRQEHGQGYDIVTLFPAAEVLEALQRLRQLPEVMVMASLEGDQLSEALNVFNQKLNTICRKAFSQVVPPLEGKRGVTAHNLRSLYGAIAVYFFCPPLQHEYAFVQHFLGHVMDSPATGHYFRFALCDDQQNPIRDKGVLLNQVERLPLGDSVGHADAPAAELTLPKLEAVSGTRTYENNGENNGKPTSLEPSAEIAALQSFREQWTQDLRVRLARLKDEFEEQLQHIQQDADPGWFLRRVTTLERENLRLRQELDQVVGRAQAQADEQELARLQAQNKALTLELRKVQDKLEQARRLLSHSALS
jgi:Telomere resolvase